MSKTELHKKPTILGSVIEIVHRACCLEVLRQHEDFYAFTTPLGAQPNTTDTTHFCWSLAQPLAIVSESLVNIMEFVWLVGHQAATSLYRNLPSQPDIVNA